VVLQNNGTNDLNLTANGGFTFTSKLANGAAYNVTVKTQPSGQICSAYNYGTSIQNGNMTSVYVHCGTAATYSVGGTLSGLTGTVVLQNNGTNDLTLTANGSFTFTSKLASSTAYNVSVKTQPAGQICFLNASNVGTILSANVSNISVTCTASGGTTYTIGGTISGLTGTVVLQNNLGNDKSWSANGIYSFSTAVSNGSTYSVTVKTQPSGQTCSVSNSSGTVSGANVTIVNVTCSTSGGTTYTIGGAISGLTGTVVLRNNGGDNLSRTVNGSFTFATGLANGAGYAVTVFTQPSGQTCAVSNGSGTVSGANVTNVNVTCSTTGGTTYTIGGAISGLTGTVVLQNNGGDNLSRTVNGSFTFATGLANGAGYAVTVFTQPSGQSCVVSNSSGTVSGANVTNISVTCSSGTPIQTSVANAFASGVASANIDNGSVFTDPANMILKYKNSSSSVRIEYTFSQVQDATHGNAYKPSSGSGSYIFNGYTDPNGVTVNGTLSYTLSFSNLVWTEIVAGVWMVSSYTMAYTFSGTLTYGGSASATVSYNYSMSIDTGTMAQSCGGSMTINSVTYNYNSNCTIQ
jgi:hypothetical protein